MKKLFILAITCAAENYDTIGKILQNLNLNALDFGFSLDLKMALILCGEQAASLKHCAPYCDGSASWLSPGKPNTIDSLWLSYNEFMASGGNKKEAKNFRNVVNPPLIID